VKDLKVNIIIEKDEDGYYAYSPELKGCQSQGNTLEEVKANIQEAVELYLETLNDREIQTIIDREVLTMALEVKVA
jgi:predicted RNase H-like HicB family nuclease